jgi:hypothetical protein
VEVVVDVMENLLRLKDQVTALATSIPTAQKPVEAASQESENFSDDASSGATEKVCDATRSGGDLAGNPPKKAQGAGAAAVAVAPPATSCTSCPTGGQLRQLARQPHQLAQMPGSQNGSAGAAPLAPNRLTAYLDVPVQGPNGGPNTASSSVSTIGPIVGLEIGSALGDDPVSYLLEGSGPDRRQMPLGRG